MPAIRCAQFAALGAQAAVRAIARVAGACANRRATKKRAHMFRSHGAVAYDVRLMSCNRDARTVSLWTPTGRVTVPYVGRPEDLKAVDTLPLGEAGLIFRRGVWLRQVAVTLPKPVVREPVNGFLGVDQGVANLAVTNDGAGRCFPAPLSPAPPAHRGSNEAGPRSLRACITSRTVSPCAATSRAVAGAGDSDAMP